MKWIDGLRKKFPEARAYLVGGAVRDTLLRRKTKDYDYVVAGVPAKDLERLLSRLGRVNLVGRTFGVFKFRPRGKKEEIDIALPRAERPKGTGSYRDVETQSDPALPIEKDLARRDFTINALAVDLATGRLVDPFGGKDDLRRRRIRAVGQARKRFREDYTRVLRGLRLAVTLGFTFEKKTWDALLAFVPRLTASRDGKHIVPTEILIREFRKAFAADPLRALILWRKAGALKAQIPHLGAWYQTGRFMAKFAPTPDRLIDLERLLKNDAAADALAAARFHGASPARLKAWTGALKKLKSKPLLGGREVMKALGLKAPSPKVGVILRALRKAQLSGKIRRHDDALAFVRKTAS